MAFTTQTVTIITIVIAGAIAGVLFFAYYYAGLTASDSEILAGSVTADATTATTSNNHHDGKGQLNTTSPYADEESLRNIKSLSPKDIEALQNGTGDAFGGLAIAAELNGYPGPRHVLAMSTQLNLTAAQEKQITEIYRQMNNQAKAIGMQIIEVEKEMNESFANRTITDEELKILLEKSAHLYGQLRYIHLSAHLETVNVLTEVQIHTYNMQRGYHNTTTGYQQNEEEAIWLVQVKPQCSNVVLYTPDQLSGMGIDILDYRYMSPDTAVCLACGCPGDYILVLSDSEDSISVLLDLGFEPVQDPSQYP